MFLNKSFCFIDMDDENILKILDEPIERRFICNSGRLPKKLFLKVPFQNVDDLIDPEQELADVDLEQELARNKVIYGVRRAVFGADIKSDVKLVGFMHYLLEMSLIDVHRHIRRIPLDTTCCYASLFLKGLRKGRSGYELKKLLDYEF